MSSTLQALDEQLSRLEKRLQTNVQPGTSTQAPIVTPSTQFQHSTPGPTAPASVLQPSSAANRLLSTHKLPAPGAPRSTWEADRTRAILTLEDQLRKLQEGNPAQQQTPLQNNSENTQPSPRQLVSLDWPMIQPQPHRAAPAVSSVLGVHRAAQGAAPPTAGFTVHAGAVSKVLDRSTTGPGTTWERSQAQAILALEKQRDDLMQQLAQYAGLNAVHQQQLMAVHARHAKALEDAQGDAGRKLSALYDSTAGAVAHARWSRQIHRALLVWRHEAVRSKRLARAERQWNIRTLYPVFCAWHELTQQARRPVLPEELQAVKRAVLQAWQLETRRAARLRHLGRRLCASRLCRLLHAWQHQADALRCKRAAMSRARAHYDNSLVWHAFVTLKDQWQWSLGAQELLTVQLQRTRVRWAFQAWRHVHSTCTRVSSILGRLRAAHALLAWRNITEYRRGVRERVAAFQHDCALQRKLRAFTLWSCTAQWLCSLRTKTKELKQLTACHQLRRAFRQLYQAVQVLHMQRRQQGWLLAVCWGGWWQHTRRAARGRRVAAAAQAARLLRLGTAALTAWITLGASRKARLQADNITRMEAYVSQLQGQVEEARHGVAVSQARTHVLESEVAVLRQEAQRGLLLGQAASLTSDQLHWQPLVPAPDVVLPPPRTRHCAHWLPAIQPELPPPLPHTSPFTPHTSPQSTAGTDVLTQDVVLVFGGVSGEDWLTDVQALVITHTGTSTTCIWMPVPVDTQSLPGGTLRPTMGWASCTAGPSSWVVVGGFDGTQETLDMVLFQAHIHGVAPRVSEEQRGPLGYGLSVTATPMSNKTQRAPVGRTDACIVHHVPGRALVLFGGYSSQQGGCMSDLWVYDMDTCGWWQPDARGAWPPARRGHVMTLVGDKLWVHGGFDGKNHLADLWWCDVNTWTWTEAVQLGCVPSARRGHACVALTDRYILLTGGYDGTQHLSDVVLLDTEDCVWRRVASQGGVGTAPPASALHTLTLAGSSCVQLCGTGALGPVNTAHLLQSPALLASQAQQQQLLGALEQLTQVSGRAGELQAHLELALWQHQDQDRQSKAMQERCAVLTQQHNSVLTDMETLRSAVHEEQAAVQQARQRADAAEVAAATAERRLQRARDAGRQVAEAAQKLQQHLMDADALIADQQAELETLKAEVTASQSLIQQLTAEHTLLHVQLATANNEAHMLRALLGTARISPREHSPKRRRKYRPYHAEQRAAEGDGAEGPIQGTQADGAGEDGDLVAGSHGGSSGGSGDSVVAGRGRQAVLTEQLEVLQSQLVNERVAAATARQQTKLLEAELSALKVELSSVSLRVAKEISAAESSRSLAQAAVQQLRAHELHHVQLVEELQGQLRSQQVARWEQEVKEPAAALAEREGPWSARQAAPSMERALEHLRSFTSR